MMANVQQDALAEAQTLLMNSMSESASNGTATANLLLARAETFEHPADAISQDFKLTAPTFRSDSNSLQQVNRLPPEVLVAIFEWCLDVDKDNDQLELREDATQLQIICSVCRKWRNLAEESPVLWRFVSGLDPPQHINKALKLSDPMPIAVVYLGGSSARLSEPEFIAAVEPHITRWSRASIVYDDLDNCPQAWEWSELSKLHTLDIVNNAAEYSRSSIVLGGGRELPNVRVVKLFDVPLRWDPGQLPALRVLQLNGYAEPERSPSTSQLLQMLMNMPKLESLCMLNVAMLADDAVQRTVTLPNLGTLQALDVPLDSIRLLLQSIQVPRSTEKCMDHNRTGRPPSEECSNNSNDYNGKLDVFGFQGYQTRISTGGFELSVFPEPRSEGIEGMGIVLRKFERELAASQGIQAEIGMPNGPDSSAVLDMLDRLPNLRALHIIQSHVSSRAGIQTLIQHLRRQLDVVEKGVWHLPHLETISINNSYLSFPELGAMCRERREATTSGYPKPIKELRIAPWLSLEHHSKSGLTIKEELQILQDALGEGRLFWGDELWNASRQT
ncbi:hypothetical protein FRC01_008913, partial [Tulasnella sp. 417]